VAKELTLELEGKLYICGFQWYVNNDINCTSARFSSPLVVGQKKKDKVRNLEQLYENEKYRIEIIMEGKWKVKNLPGVVLVSVECLL
jgi:hypothetical protein